MAGQLTEEQYKEIKDAIADIAGVKADMAAIVAIFPQLKLQYGEVVESIKEVHEMRTDLAKMKVALIDGNGTKSVSQRLDILEKKPPRFSWKMVWVMGGIIITVVGLLIGFDFFSFEDIRDNIKTLSETLINHIATTIQ